MSRAPRRRDWSIALAVFTVASVVYTFPLATNLARANRLDSPDAMLNAWILSWNLHQIQTDPRHLFDANIFFPEKGTLAYSENLLTGSLLAAPVAVFTDNPILIHNAALVSAFLLTGMATFALAFDVTGDRGASLVAGILFAFAPFRFAHLPHLQLQLAFGIPLSLVLARRMVTGEGGGVTVVLFAVTAAATFGSSVYYAVYVASVVPLVVAFELYHLERGGWRRALIRLGAASASALALTLPLALPYVEKFRSGTVRSLSAASQFSAGPVEYLSSFSWVHGFLPKASEPLFPGFVATALAVCALLGASRPGSRKWCWGAIGVLGVALSAGPALGLFSFLYQVLAPYRALRVPSRAGVLFLLAVAVLAAIAFARVRSTPLRRALAIVAAIECLAAPLPLRFDEPTYPPIYRDVEALTEPGALVELPFPPRERFQDNAIYVYRSIFHWRDLVNGYSGFAPPSYRRAHRLLMRGDLGNGLETLRQEGVGYVLAHEGRLGPRMLRRIRRARDDAQLVLIAERETDRLYAIEPRQ